MMDNLDAFLNRLTAHLSTASGHLTTEALRHMIMDARQWPPPNDPKLEGQGRGIPCGGMLVNYVGSTAHWSPWLEWRGGPCPLPPGVDMDYRFVDGAESPGMSHRAHWGATADVHWAIGSFRYRADNPAGWLPRGEFIPPAELWNDGCPVRCEWMDRNRGSVAITSPHPPIPDRATHIRLVARQPQAGLPEGMAGPDQRGDYWIEMPHGTRHRITPLCPRYNERMADAWAFVARGGER